MAQGDSGKVIAACVELFQTLHHEALRAKSIKVIESALPDLNQIMTLTSDILSSSEDTSVKHRVSEICHKTYGLFSQGMISQEQVARLVPTFITELGTEPDDADYLTKSLNDALRSSAKVSSYQEPTPVWEESNPLTLEILKMAPLEKLSTSGMHDYTALKEFEDSLKFLIAWERKWSKPHIFTVEEIADYLCFQHELIAFSGHMEPGNMLIYIEELTNAAQETGDTVQQVMKKMLSLKDWEKSTALAVLDHMISSDSMDTMDWDQFGMVVSGLRPEDAPPVALLAKMVSKPLNLNHVSIRTRHRFRMRFFTAER